MVSNTPSRTPNSQTAVFCTAFVDSDPIRYQSWIDYYTKFFEGENVDLYLYNDGPVSASLNLQGAQLITFDASLGRVNLEIFPGWKRSFSTAVRQLGDQYRFLGHIESDLVILPEGRDTFLKTLRSSGYWTGFIHYYWCFEPAIQVINSSRVRQFFTQRYAQLSDYNREEHFETEIQQALVPRIMLRGTRVEEREIDLNEHYSYLAQMPIHQFHETYPDGYIPWKGKLPSSISRERLAIEITRLRWRYRYWKQSGNRASK